MHKRSVALYLILGLIFGIFAHAYAVKWYRAHFPVIVTQTKVLDSTKTVYINGPITTQTVLKYVKVADKKQIDKLLKENAILRATVAQITETVGHSISTGTGTVTVEHLPNVAAQNQDPIYHFRDWRLDFRMQGTFGQYKLDQKFEVLSSTGKDKQGKPFSIVKLFELGPGDEKREIPTSTTSIVTDNTVDHWMLFPTFQTGFLVGRDFANGYSSNGALVGAQWLKFGRSYEDSRLALLSPVFKFGTQNEFGFLPVSWNIANFRNWIPAKNLWLSPYVGTHDIFGHSHTLGVAVTASF